MTMSRTERELFLLTVLPLLISGMFLLWFVSTYPKNFAAAFSLLAALTIVSGIIYRRIRKNFVDPVIRLNQQLEEPNLVLIPETFPDGTLIQDLVYKLREKNAQLEEDNQQQLLTVNNTADRLQKRIHQLEDENLGADNLLNQLRSAHALENAYIRNIASLCEQPLSSIIGHINLLAEDTNSVSEDILSEINSAGTQIVFLARELLEHNYPEKKESQFDIHQLVDDAIALINPIVDKRDIRLLPIFDEHARFEFTGHPELIKALLFNYILSQLLNRNIENNQPLILQISFIAGARLTFNLSPLQQSDTTYNLARLNDLVGLMEAKFEDTLISTPVSATRIPGKRIRSLTAYIAVNNYIQRRSIESRLNNLGVDIVEDKTRADICLVCFEKHHEIMNFTKDLDSKTHVLLLHNTTLYNQPNWHQLKSPVDHNELIKTLHKLEDSQQQHHQLMVVDDNLSNLRLITLFLEELGHHVVATDNPLEAVSIIAKTEFDLIFMDIQMPGMTGTKASEVIREQGFEGIIIALTAHLTEVESEEIARCGINSTLLKPVDKTTLSQIINHYLHGIDTQTVLQNPPTEGIFNEELALQRANHRAELAAELLQILIESLPEDQENLNAAYALHDVEEFRRHVHKINGGLRYCGVPRLGIAIDNLETLAKQQDSLDSEETKIALSVSNNEINALRSWYLSTSSPFESKSAVAQLD